MNRTDELTDWQIKHLGELRTIRHDARRVLKSGNPANRAYAQEVLDGLPTMFASVYSTPGPEPVETEA